MHCNLDRYGCAVAGDLTWHHDTGGRRGVGGSGQLAWMTECRRSRRQGRRSQQAL
jgi:hypothetical protein